MFILIGIVQVFGMHFCLICDVKSFGAYASGRFDSAYGKYRHVAP